MAPETPKQQRAWYARPKFVDSLLGGASDIIGSVAKGVAPEVVGAIDLDAIVQQIDLQALIERVDVNALVQQVDLNAILAGVDVDALLARIDVNTLLEHLDLDALVERTEIGSLIARSSVGVAEKVLDVARSHGVGLDAFVHRWTDRVLRRRGEKRPPGPPLLVGPNAPSR